MTNRQRLEKAKILESNITLSPAQEKAIEKLTKEEVDVLISAKRKLKDKFPPEDLAKPITHHH